MAESFKHHRTATRAVGTTVIVCVVAGVLLTHSGFSAQPVVFAADEDNLWERFTRGPCTLIADVPIVPTAPGLTPMSAVASSVIGYFERTFPLLGPPAPNRLPQLLALSASAVKSDKTRAERLEQTWLEAEQQANDVYFRFAKFRPQATEGMIRAYALQEYSLANVEGLERIAASRWQRVDVKRASSAPAAVREGKPAIVVADGGRSAILIVGQYSAEQDWAIAIDPTQAKPLRLKAEDVLLREQDRTSTREFARKARESIRGEVVVVDEPTSCTPRQRPAGIRFVDMSRLRDTDAFVIRNWTVDTTALRKALKE